MSLTPQGQLRWNIDVGLNPTYDGTVQAPAVVNGVVYVPTKTNLVYLRGDTGGRIALADTSPNQPTTPVVVNGVAYVGGVGGFTGALQAFDATTGVLLYYSHTATVAFTSPAVAPDGTVALGGDDELLSSVVAYVRTEVFFANGRLDTARQLLERAADAVAPGRSATAAALYGALHMRAALAAARNWVPSPAIPAERRSHFYIDVAQAHVHAGAHDNARAALCSAQTVAPEHTSSHPRVQEMLAHLGS